MGKANHQKQELTEKILLHLADCVDFGFHYRLKKDLGISGKSIRDLIKTNEKGLNEGIAELRRSKFIEKKANYDGSMRIVLTEKGKLRALNLRFKKLSRLKANWDGKWRFVSFDIPNELKKGRNALRYRVQLAGFYELQESLFLYPYDCRREIEDFVELFKLGEFVRFGTMDFIDNEKRLKSFFRLYQQ